MKFCPYCHEKISYGKLINYSLGKGFVKHEPCPHCNKTYKVTLNIFFTIAMIAIVFGIVALGLKAEGRFENRLYSFIILAVSLPIFPFFIKLSNEAE